MTRGGVAIVAVAAILTAAAPSEATELSDDELRKLSRRALTSGRALERLRHVERVDGRRVDLESALQGSPEEVRARLTELTEQATTVESDAATKRAQARAILRQARFEATPFPRPFRGVLRRIGAWLQGPADWLARFFDGVIRRFPGGRVGLWLVVATALAATTAAVARRLIRGRALAAEVRHARRLTGDESPVELERAARDAEESGDFERALRLLFRAGLLRLDRAKVISFHPALTTGEVSRSIRSASFDKVATTFDEVVYGGREPAPSDVDAARGGWATVLREVAA